MNTVKTLALVCVLVWTDHGAKGQQFASDESMKDYGVLAAGLGSLIGGIDKDEKPNLKGMTRSLNRMASMMQGVTGSNGAPPFADDKYFMEIEKVFTRMGPYVCFLPQSTPKKASDLSPVLGGVIGGLIGTKVAEERLRRQKDADSQISLISGVGTIAGALGGLSGWEVVRGKFGRPNASAIVEMIPQFVEKMGDMKSILKGSFQPLSEQKYKNFKLLVERDLSKALEKMSNFFVDARTSFKGNQSEASVKAKSDAFDLRFRAISPELTEIAKCVASMAGVYGGIIGYVMPRYDETRLNSPDHIGTSGKLPDPGLNHTVRDNVTGVKESLKKMRAFEKDSSGQAKNDKWDVFGGALDDIADSAGEIGGYSGVIGGMMAEVLANGAAAQVGKFLHWDINEEDDDDDPRGPKITNEDTLNKLKQTLPKDGLNRLDYFQQKCIQTVTIGLEHFGRLHKYGNMHPGALHFNGPYGDESNGVSTIGMQKHLMGNQWVGDWAKLPKKKELVKSVSVQDLETVLKEKQLNNAIVLFVNNIVADAGEDSGVMKVLTGKVEFKDAQKDDVQAISVEVLAALKPTVIGNMSASNLVDIFTSQMPGRNPAMFKIFLKYISNQQINDALDIIQTQQNENRWSIYNGIAMEISEELVHRFGSDAFSKLCPFASGITLSIIKMATPEHFINTNILSCMKKYKEDLPSKVKEAIKEKTMQSPNITVEQIDAMRGFTDQFEDILWFLVTPQQLTTLINTGHFLALKNLSPQKRNKIMNAIKFRMNISSSNENSTQYLRNLGELICGIPPYKLEETVPSADLESVRANWTKDCITEPNKKWNQDAKDCINYPGELKRNKCNKVRKMMLPNLKQVLNAHRWTRSSVGKGLSKLTGKLPLAVSYSLNGLTSSEISKIPNAVLHDSLDIISENSKLCFSQRREIFKKVVEAGQKVDNVDDLRKIGSLLAAVDLSNENANFINTVLTETPTLLMQFSKVKMVSLLDKLFADMSAGDLINSKTPLSPFIPTYKLRALSSLNMDSIAQMRWTSSQAIEIVDRYKALNDKTTLDMDDIKTLGKAASGITCDDVANLPLSSMAYLSRLIDYAIGNKISSSLANCIATKLYLCIKMDYIKGSQFNSLISKNIPGNILIFLPSTVLAHAAYGKDCVSLVRKLGQANLDLLSPGPGHLAIEGLLQVAKICFDSLEEKHETATSGSILFFSTSEHGNGNQHEHNNQMKNGSQAMSNGHNAPSRRRRNSNNSSNAQNMKSHKHNLQNEPLLYAENVFTLGKLACGLKRFNNTVSTNAMVQLAKVFPMCFDSITQKRKEQINAMFETNIGDFDRDYLNFLHVLAPLLPLIDPKYIENNISSKAAAILMQNLPVKALLMHNNKRPLVGDLSTKTLTLEDNLAIVIPKKTTELDLNFKLFDMRAFADAIFPKLIEYVKNKNKTGKDPAEINFMQDSGFGEGPDYSQSQYSYNYSDSDYYEDSPPPSRKRRQAEAQNVEGSSDASGATESTSNSESESVSVFPDNGVTFELLILAGPAIIGLKYEDIEWMDEDMFKDSLPLMGRYEGWTNAQLDKIESKMMTIYGKSPTWSASLLQDLGHLSVMLDAISIDGLEHLDLETLGSMSRVKWESNDIQRKLLYRYIQLKKIEVSQLTGVELVAAGNLLCAIDTSDIPNLNDEAIKFALAAIGKKRCFDEEKRLAFKDKVLAALNLSVKRPSLLAELGILGGAMSIEEFQSISPAKSSLVSSDALRVAKADSVVKGWNESHFALMGNQNGAAIMGRPDIFKDLSDKSKNAVFRAAFGGNAGMMSTLIDLMKHGKQRSLAAFTGMFNNMLQSTAMLFSIALPIDTKIPQRAGPGSVYGLVDSQTFVKPPPMDFSFGLSKTDFVGSFSNTFLEDNRFITFINKVASNLFSSKILDVMKGDMSFNDLADNEIKDVPPTVFVGLKVSQIHDMSPKVVGSILDSPKAARDPTSMTKVVRRLETSQFENAMVLLNKKMKEDNGSTPWKPPIKTQEVMAKNYLQRLTTNKSVSDVEVVDKFIENICSIVAGLPPTMINTIPMVESKKKEALDCMGASYKDLSPVQKKQITKWAMQKPNSVKGRTGDKTIAMPSLQDIKDLGGFMMDIPVRSVQKTLSDPQSALELVENGNLQHLDNLHPNFEKMSKMTMKKLVNSSKDKFDDQSFLDKLGPSKCEIPLKNVKNTMSKDTLKYLANYTMTQCKDKETLLRESLDECVGEKALRLQRCQLLQKQASTTKFKVEDSFVKEEKWHRVGLNRFNMMRELADSLLSGTDFSKMNATEIKNSAGALGGLSPLDMDKLPDSSVLEAMDVIKDNTNLSPKQRKIMFQKAQSAGFSFDKESSLMDLGGLVSEVPVADFLTISAENIQKSMKSLMKRAQEFSKSQKRAIVGRLENVSMDEMLDDNLGAFAAEIPLKKLKTLKNVNFTKLKDKPWERDQAAELIDNYLNSTDDGKIDVDLLSEMGSTVVGLKCSNVMSMEYYEAQEGATLIDSQADMEPDMDECIQTKLDFSNQVEMGKDYMTNDTGEADLETTLEAVPNDPAVFYEPEVVNATPDALCNIIYRKIGEAQLSSLPPGPSDGRLVELAEGAIDCLKRDPDRDFTVLEEDDVEMLGKLICDIPPKSYVSMSSTAFDTALENMQECFHRFKKDHVTELHVLVKTHLGEASTWDETTLSSLGSLMALMSKEDIQNTIQEFFAESYDDIVPPKIDSSLEAHSLMNYDEFYAKARESLSEESEEEPAARRKRTTTRTPSYDNIVSLGPGNSGWSVEELRRISNDDILATIDVLGSVEDWTLSKMEVLIQRIEEALSQKMHEWTTSVVSDAKHILTALTADQISGLDISSLETTTSLSDVKWSSDKRTAAYNVFITKTSKTPGTLSAEDIAGLGNIFCGMNNVKMSDIPSSVISKALKDMGKLTCYSQDQVDALYTLVYNSNTFQVPAGALLNSMGSIAAGMPTDDLKQIAVEDMPMLSVYAIQLMSPLRFKDAMTNTHLAAAGVTNLAAIIRNKPVYNALTTEQRNTVNNAAYGSRAVAEEDQTTLENDDDVADNTVNTPPNDDPNNNQDDNRNIEETVTTTSKATTTSGGKYWTANVYAILICLYLLVLLM